VLERLLATEPDNFDAACQLGLVLGRLNRVNEAAEHMSGVARRRPGDPEASGMLGRVYKDMWRAHWESIEDEPQRLEAAIRTSQTAEFAAASYLTAYRRHLDYYNGINLVALLRVLEHLARRTGRSHAAIPELPVADICTSVRVAAAVARDRARSAAVRTADTDEMIWASATLGELAVLLGEPRDAERYYAEAAGVPGVSYFQLDSMLAQLRLLERLAFKPDAVAAATQQLRTALALRSTPARQFGKVVIASGHMIDAPDRPDPRFPPEEEERVRARIAAVLDDWRIGVGDLAIASAARGTDILFAELCAARGAHVRIHLPLPSAAFVETSVRLGTSTWPDRYFDLLEQCEVAYQQERLGAPPQETSVFARNNRWIINTAHAEADADLDREAAPRLHALLVWDGRPTGDGPGGTSDFAESVRRLGGRRAVIDPAHPDR
jgi:hypothetical protein